MCIYIYIYIYIYMYIYIYINELPKTHNLLVCKFSASMAVFRVLILFFDLHADVYLN